MSGFAGGIVYGLGASVLVAVSTILGVWLERKVSGRIQRRYGPQEQGPFGLLQTVFDVVKLLLKEDITPKNADVRPFRLAPLLTFTPIAAVLVVVPFAAGWVPLDTRIGVLLFLAIPSLSVLGLLIGGWSSGNTYATLGALRGAAQMVSYEVPRTLSVLAVVLLAGSMRPLDIVERWEWWWIPVLFIGFVVYIISTIAELNRGPFDLPEAESELVAGYFADYSGIRWAIFMMSEYAGMLLASLMAGVLFLGGTHDLPGAWGVLLLAVIVAVFAVFFVWVRWTYPRMRPDQLMEYAWKVLTPLAILQLVIVGVVIAWEA
ncbi:MAG: NADH-quinone oxidoreductase subunit NuoH [Coriobacteriia bacterium]